LYAVFKELDLPDDTVASLELAVAATALSESEPAEDDGVALLEHLGVSYPRVCHVRVHSTLPVPRGARTRSPRDRLIVTELPIAEGQVVHASLARCTCAKCLQDHVSDTLRGQYVATDYCSFR
jgi:hypothetical protein